MVLRRIGRERQSPPPDVVRRSEQLKLHPSKAAGDQSMIVQHPHPDGDVESPVVKLPVRATAENIRRWSTFLDSSWIPHADMLCVRNMPLLLLPMAHPT